MFEGHKAPITSLDITTFKHHGDRLVSGSSFGNVKIWDLEKYVQTGSIKIKTEVLKTHIIQKQDSLCICGTNGVFLIDGIIHNSHNEYRNKLNITSSNMCFFKEEPNKIVTGCDDNRLVVEDIRLYDDGANFTSSFR